MINTLCNHPNSGAKNCTPALMIITKTVDNRIVAVPSLCKVIGNNLCSQQI